MNTKFQNPGLFWINQPRQYTISDGNIVIETEPGTDFWQRTYYGFQNDNAPALLTKTYEKFFSFTVKTVFNSERRFDQCGVLIYQNSENWIKASIEYVNEEYQKLGSVVTNAGYSDWATTDIPAVQKYMHYRLSRRESDYCIENSLDGIRYQQMRIAHLTEGADGIQIGIYACSPEKSSFQAVFSEIQFSECQWKAHE